MFFVGKYLFLKISVSGGTDLTSRRELCREPLSKYRRQKIKRGIPIFLQVNFKTPPIQISQTNFKKGYVNFLGAIFFSP